MTKTRLTRKNVLKLILDYYHSLGPDVYKEAQELFTSKNFNSAMVQPLSNSCVVLRNKIPGSTGKQTHIHVTGDNRLFFYTVPELNDIQNSIDKRVVCHVSRSNIENLEGNAGPHHLLDVVKSSTLTKVAFRQNENPQVQVSKTSQDGTHFMRLRNALHVDDLLIFLKYANGEENSSRLFAVGIPSAFYSGSYTVSTSHLTPLEGQGNISVKTALKDISETVAPDVMIDTFEEIADSIYQQLVDAADSDDDDKESFAPEEYMDDSSDKHIASKRPATNPKLGKSAIRHNKYKCAFASEDQPHTTFLKPDDTPYMEVHHLIPMGQQHCFKNKLDTRANLVPVCPLCHRKLHHGKKSEVAALITTLFNARFDSLSQSGLSVTKDGTPLTESLLKTFY